jgi:cysteine sulfinate desulfinase/cysteine desulfurase-like protein
MGHGKEAASSSLRFSLGRGNDMEQIGPAADILARTVKSMRELG